MAVRIFVLYNVVFFQNSAIFKTRFRRFIEFVYTLLIDLIIFSNFLVLNLFFNPVIVRVVFVTVVYYFVVENLRKPLFYVQF